MRLLLKLIIICFVVFSCSNNNPESYESENFALSLKAPNGEVLANSLEELSNKLSMDSHNLQITNIEYINIVKKGKLAASVEYSLNNNLQKVLIVRNIDNFNFEKGTILKFVSQPKSADIFAKISKDIYISCSGGSCCYPSGLYDSNTGTITTSCKCDYGDNSQCVMKISETPPQNNWEHVQQNKRNLISTFPLASIFLS